MTAYIVYGSKKTRITLYASDGVTPTLRVTLQKEDKEGLQLTFNPEGAATKLGSGAYWANKWTHHGFRPTLSIKWALGLDSSMETWSGSAWLAPVSSITPIVLTKIFNVAFQSPCLVEPHMDKGYSFTAQPDPGKPLVFRDMKNVAHTGLALDLVGTLVATALPDWASL